jgi:hypothetical protein
MGPTILILYLTALAWLWVGLGMADLSDWYLHFSQSILLVVSVAVFALHFLADSGAPEARRAQLLAKRLADRREWPDDLSLCKVLPEVKALREAIHLNAAPALALLIHERPQVRIAALAALEFRKHWRHGQEELVLRLAQQSDEPLVRAAAVSALASADQRRLVERLAEFLCDPSWEVRRATSEALLWDTEARWSWIRQAVRRSLADPTHAEDGPLLPNGQLLTAEAVKDLTAWAGEKGVLAIRAALTLAVHFSRILVEQPDEALVQDLRRLLADPHAPTPLRLELANILQTHRLLDRPLQENLLDPLNPAPLRLLAAEALLETGVHNGAVTALRSVARLPNREIALATANVVQRRLGIELGLGIGRTLPPVHSRQAAEVTRRVMMWAAEYDPPESVPASESLTR